MRAIIPEVIKRIFKALLILTLGFGVSYGTYTIYRYYFPAVSKQKYNLPLYTLDSKGMNMTRENLTTNSEKLEFCFGVEYDNKIFCYEKYGEQRSFRDDGTLRLVELYKHNIFPRSQ